MSHDHVDESLKDIVEISTAIAHHMTVNANKAFRILATQEPENPERFTHMMNLCKVTADLLIVVRIAREVLALSSLLTPVVSLRVTDLAM